MRIDEAALAAHLEQAIPGLTAAYLFGSVARGEATATSDVDLGLLFERAPTAGDRLALLGIADVLAAAIGRAIDLVVMNDAPVDLVHRIMRDGVLVVDANRSARIQFEVAARNAYFDLAPHLLRYRRAPASVIEP